MPEYLVRVSIENRPGIADPEGDTIHRDLVLRGGFDFVSRIRTAKTLMFTVSAAGSAEAEGQVAKMCEQLRIYNPLVSRAVIESDQIK